ncbi:MAG: dTDP-4-dehydrorhamnose 3,5-epimerase [Clostridia bacterium]|nr:dTDP-4-dehydrorhamnose 3,5-epimerase [Clostridia bacterium]MBQ6708034.1 dTDP-4-dehydrorhamnose 3,5-epimerase [Clostridia bacterium]
MKVLETNLKDAVIIEPQVFGDNRGWFSETYSKKKFEEIGINTEFVQDNASRSAVKGTVRGLHCQTNPCAQAKLVSCTRGAVKDVIVDIRKGSPTYLKSIAVELSEDNHRMLFVPKGFLHGFVTLTDDVELRYKVDEYYSPENDRSICYCDEIFGIDWGVKNPVLSEKDKNAPKFEESDVEFVYGK